MSDTARETLGKNEFAPQLEGQTHQSSEERGQALERDDLTLSRLGKKPVLKRRFKLVSIVAFNCLNLNTWGTVFQIIGLGLLNGGPAGSFYSWIIIWLGAATVFSCLAELASMYPTAAGQYHWVALLAPASGRNFLSYVTGWLTVLGWLSGVSASTYISGTLLQALIGLVDSAYSPQLWHGTLLVYGVLAVCFIFTVLLGRSLHHIETAVFVVYILGFFVVMIPILRLAPQYASGETVFTTFVNGGAWPTQGLSFFVGLSGWAFATLGGDAAVHMSEEVHNASIVVPRSILIGLVFNFLVGLAMLVAELFCIPDANGLLSLGLQYPFVQVFLNSTGSVWGSALLLAIIIFCQIGLNICNVAAGSRVLWSFSRDRGVPGWQYLNRVSAKDRLPVVAIVVTILFSVLLILISVGSSVAFNDVISLNVDALFGSYLLSCSLLLWRRCTGGIVDPSGGATAMTESSDAETSVKVAWGPFHMQGYPGIAVNTIACAYMVLILFFSIWPPATPVTTGASMNYAIVMFAGCALIGAVYYFISAKRTYKGPIIEAVER